MAIPPTISEGATGPTVRWAQYLLVRRTPLFASRELPRDRPVEVGKTDTHVVLRAGEWSAWLTIALAREV